SHPPPLPRHRRLPAAIGRRVPGHAPHLSDGARAASWPPRPPPSHPLLPPQRRQRCLAVRSPLPACNLVKGRLRLQPHGTDRRLKRARTSPTSRVASSAPSPSWERSYPLRLAPPCRPSCVGHQPSLSASSAMGRPIS